ncbi:MAG: hypothetical protein ACI4DR_03545 [Roseburia sp.]
MKKTTCDLLRKLDLQQLEELSKRFSAKHPHNRSIIFKIQSIIDEKRLQQVEDDLLSLIEEVKSAPDGAGNTEQGNETR